MRFTGSALALLKRLEALRLRAYTDDGGKLTIGYGHTGPDVTPGLFWTRAQAEAALDRDLRRFIPGVKQIVSRAPRALNDNEFSTLVIFAFNVGLTALACSTALRDILNGRLEDVPRALALWNIVHDKSGVPVVNQTLVKRRAAEIALWNASPEI